MDSTTQQFINGVHNLLQNEDIPYDAAQDALGFITQDGKEILCGGRINIGTEGAIGMIRGLHFGFNSQGTLVMYLKTETTVDILVGSTWTTIISGLTSGNEITFANYASLSGSWTFINGVDGFWKVNNAFPLYPIQIYNSSKNFHGKILIDKGRMLLWARQDPATAIQGANMDLTGLYGSNIDPQNSSVYATKANEAVGVGDGSTKSFSGILNAKQGDSQCNVFGIVINAPTGSGKTITNIQPDLPTNPTKLNITASSHGLSSGDTIIITGLPASTAGTGTITSGGYAQTLVGSGTAFTTQLKSGCIIKAGTGFAFSDPTRIQGTAIVGSIANDTHLSFQGLNFIDAGSGSFTFENPSQLVNIAVVVTVIDANNFSIPTSAFPVGTIFSPYASGGTVTKCEILIDNNQGVLSSIIGSTGTINYSSGAYTFTTINAMPNSSEALATYQYENSNNGGVTDFTSSATRTAGQGFQLRQDQGGDPIEKVLVGQDGAYYSMKEHSVYRVTIAADDLSFDNQIYYQNMGLASPNSAVSTKLGIIFLNVANPLKPEMTLLKKDPVGDTIIPDILFSGFKFANYDPSDAFMDTWDRYIILSCKQQGSPNNDRILVMNPAKPGSVNICPYNSRMFAKDSEDNLYCGSPITQSVYNIFSGFDDMNNPIQSYWVSNGSKYGNLNTRSLKWRFIQEELKRARRLRVRGFISPSQQVQVFLQADDGNFQPIGTILGNGSYVDNNDNQIIGQNFIGNNIIGGGGGSISVNAYFWEMKMPPGKYRKRAIKFVPQTIGYFDFAFTSDWDIELFEARLPKRFRQKQNVSFAGVPNQP